MEIQTLYIGLRSPMFISNQDGYVEDNQTAFLNEKYLSTTGKLETFATYKVKLDKRDFILHLSINLEAKLHQDLKSKVVRIKNLKSKGFKAYCAFEDEIPKNLLGFKNDVYDVFSHQSKLPEIVKKILDKVSYELESKAKILLLKKIINTKSFKIFDEKQLKIQANILKQKENLSIKLKDDQKAWLEYTNFFYPKKPVIKFL